ncbi:MAG: glycosyltransferase family 39 protein [Lachnospiraceae bacterium]|nr:glycosyltransferase family 39 protein [Lachnospiraceae bacterium]
MNWNNANNHEKIKLNRPDYIWWFAFAVLTLIFTFRVAERFFSSLDATAFITLFMCGVGGFLLYYIARFVGSKPSPHIRFLWVMIVTFIIIRFNFPAEVLNNNKLFIGSAMLVADADKVFFDGAAGLYVDVLSFLFAFLGNKEVVVFYLQFILQTISIIMLYFTLRLLSGAIVAYTTTLILAISLGFSEAAVRYQPEAVYLFLWSAVLLITVGCFKGFLKDMSVSNSAKRSMIIIVGFFAGITLFYDLLGILLIGTGFYLIYLNYHRVKQYMFENIYYIIGNCIGIFVMLFREAVLRSNIVSENISGWFDRYQIEISYKIMIPKEKLPILILVTVFCLILIITFLRSGSKSQVIFSFYILMLSVVLPVLSLNTLGLDMWLIFAWAALAGHGLKSLFDLGIIKNEELREAMISKEEELKDMKEHIELVSKRSESKAVHCETAEDVSLEEESADDAEEMAEEKIEENEEIAEDKAEDKEENIQEDNIKEKPEENTAEEKTVPEEIIEEKNEVIKDANDNVKPDIPKEENPYFAKAPKQETESRYDTSTGTKYLENPLPLPPKPVRRIMEYPFKVTEEMMHYDVDVAEHDDYDLK